MLLHLQALKAQLPMCFKFSLDQINKNHLITRISLCVVAIVAATYVVLLIQNSDPAIHPYWMAGSDTVHKCSASLIPKNFVSEHIPVSDYVCHHNVAGRVILSYINIISGTQGCTVRPKPP